VRLSAAPKTSAAPTGRVSAAHHHIVLYHGDTAGLDHYALAVHAETALAAAADALRRGGIGAEGPQHFEAFHGLAVRLRDVDGYVCEMTVPMPVIEVEPTAPPPFQMVALTHIKVKTFDPARSAQWWHEHMGLRLSDMIPGTFYWVRCRREHATIALIRGSSHGMHHLGFELESWDEIRRMLDHLAGRGVKIEYGPGRHGPGNSIFTYVVDPWGIRWEFQCDSAPVVADDAPAGVWDPVKGRRGAVNLWGPAPPDSFMQT
jgi:catechol 2,3-dioxygenase-like lactoylglutathione lyase family enzyme